MRKLLLIIIISVFMQIPVDAGSTRSQNITNYQGKRVGIVKSDSSSGTRKFYGSNGQYQGEIKKNGQITDYQGKTVGRIK